MLNNYLYSQITRNFPHQPTDEQHLALQKLADFLLSQESDLLFLLKGYAGTGKTSLIGALVKTMAELKQKSVLLAPTGRAAKVFSGYAGQKAYTIHKKIYRQKAFSNEPSGFLPADNLHKDTLFIVDEASMIANNSVDSIFFGSGRLLDDLIHYVYGGQNCRLMLVGDDAQLPPVMQSESPALQVETLRGYQLHVIEASLTQVVRQERNSGILTNATLLRDALRNACVEIFPKLQLKGFADCRKVTGEELIEELASAYSRDGVEETMVISRSNKRATIYNNGIRNRILYREEELSTGDRLMVARNNYYWTQGCKEMDFIANGEIIEVAGMRCRLIATPGHTQGSCCYYFEGDGILISGDTLFQESIGRTDLPTGSYSALIHSVQDKLMSLPDEVKVYPGHGDETSIGHERKYNPFV